MRRFGLTGAALVAVLMSIAGAASTASAACKRTFNAAEGGYANNTLPYCSVKEAGGGWAKVTLPGINTNIPGVVCAKVEAGEVGSWSDNRCTEKVGATREYVLVYTGNWLRGEAKVRSAAVTPTDTVDAAAHLNMPGVKIKVECTGSTIKAENTEIKEVDLVRASSVVFTSCATTEPATKCTLAESTVKTQAIEAIAITGTAPADTLLVKPQTKTQLATLSFTETNTCALAGEEPVKGSVLLKAPTGQSEQVTEGLEGLGSVENGSLEVGAGNRAFIEGGKLLLKLEGGSKWAFY